MSERTHGLTSSAEYRIWARMKSRCHNKNTKDYKFYGGRGISVCEEWKNSFEQFYADMGPRPSSEHSIDRADFNADYGPENCSWILTKKQNSNRRSCVFVEINGQKMCLKDAAILHGLKPKSVQCRHQRGWPENRLFEPV